MTHPVPRFLLGAVCLLAGAAAAPAAGKGKAAEEFGKDVQMAPFVVKGKPVSVAIHARTKGDRRYGEKFADEVVEIALETLEAADTGRGLLIVGREGEPHPIHFFRRFLELARAGRLDPGLAATVAQVEGMVAKMQGIVKIEPDKDTEDMGITFDTILPALPMPLEGASARLYQLAWAEGFDPARVERMLLALAPAGLEREGLIRYDWVLYLPPNAETSRVLKDIVNRAMKKEKMGLMKRAAVRSALFVFAPVVRKATEGMRKGMLYRTILDARSPWSDDDINQLTREYVGAIMPDFKPGSGDEHARALAAIEKQKAANAEYAKDPFVKPERLATFDPAAYAAFAGAYGPVTDKEGKPVKPRRIFSRRDGAFLWQNGPDDTKPRPVHPAGERLLASEDGKRTMRFIVDDTGAVTGVEERWHRGRRTLPRYTAEWTPETGEKGRTAKP